MVFVLDNYDSFTYNLVQYMGELGAEVVVRRNDELTPEEVEAMHPDRILLSPGPCTPEEAGISIALIKHFARRAEEGGPRVPILGVCLGHQAIGAAFGGNVVRAEKLMHGKTSEVEHDGRTIFADIPSAMTCTRYHSLIVAEEGLPEELEITARVAERQTSSEREGKASSKKKGKKAKAGESVSGAGTIMGLRHKTLPIEGVQFHPESVLTTHGKKIIDNFLKM
ncbi:MAG TPA: aminodeoxychorismate/anthranilate synthase component II [Acidobacteriaceae bacterium]|nr:aminodeoxychorismate/anthranilate synthase component II [Acidobacteriaceae bacterium]